MKENRFKYSVLGNAKLKDTKNTVRVENLLDSGIDGMSIDISSKEKHEFGLKNVIITKDTAFNISHFGLDYLGRIKCLSQQSIYYMPEKDVIAFAFNSKLLPERFTLVGELKGKIVFRSEYITPRKDPKVNWFWIVYAVASAAAYVVDKIDYSEVTTTHTDADGNTTSETITKKSFGGSIARGDEDESGDYDICNEVNYVTREGTEFISDNLYIEYSNITSECIPLPKLKQIQITTHNIEEFELKV